MRPYQRIAHLGEIPRGGRCLVIEGFDDTIKATPPVAPTIGQPAASPIGFPGVTKPSSDFAAVRDGRRATLLGYLVDLTNARSFSAGTALPLALAGNVFMSDPLFDLAGNSQAGVARVHFQDENFNPVGTYVTALPSSIYHVPFTQVAIENFAQPGKFLYIVYGVDVDLVPGASQQVQATILNTVTIAGQRTVNGINAVGIDVLASFADEVTRAGQAFQGGCSTTAGGAGNLGAAQVFNPVGSGIVTYVDSMSYGNGTTSGKFTLNTYAAGLATDNGTALNKNLSGASSLSHIRSKNNAATQGNVTEQFAQNANFSQRLIFSPPFRLTEGTGVGFEDATANEVCFFGFEFREKTT